MRYSSKSFALLLGFFCGVFFHLVNAESGPANGKQPLDPVKEFRYKEVLQKLSLIHI